MDYKKFVEMSKGKHTLLLYDDTVDYLTIEAYYIKSGLINHERCFYFTHGDVEEIEQAFKTLGIDVEKYSRNGLLYILRIPEQKDSKGLMNTFKEIANIIPSRFGQHIRIIGRIVPNVSSLNGICAELLFEHIAHTKFCEGKMSLLCHYNTDEIEEKHKEEWIVSVLQRHHFSFWPTRWLDGIVFTGNRILGTPRFPVYNDFAS